MALGLIVAACSDAERTATEGAPQGEAKHGGSTPTLPAPGATPMTLSHSALEQMRVLRDEKLSRSPEQKKIGSDLLLESKRRRGDRLFDSLPKLRRSVAVTPEGATLVDITATVSEPLLERIEALGGYVESSFPRFDAIRAEVPIDELETLAAEPDVRRIRRAAEPIVNKVNTSQGDVAHRAAFARSLRGIDGTGVIVGVISDGATTVNARQAQGDLPPDPAVQILPGQGGTGDEGTAMMEIIFDLAPGAQLKFARGTGGPGTMANNIEALQAAGANIIVDDLSYLNEAAFQDDLIAKSVEKVTNLGVLYFSSAGNSGNFNDGESGVYEGNYTPSTAIPTAPQLDGHASVHNFGAAISNPITVDAPNLITLKWSDPLNTSFNDYDLFLFEPTVTNVIQSSIDTQDGNPANGDDDPFEDLDSTPFDDTGNRIVVAYWPDPDVPDPVRFLHLNTHRGRLGTSTSGQIFGHAAATNAFAVAAVNVNLAGGGAFLTGGGYPVEFFSSDGPRRVFFTDNGTPITTGIFTAPDGGFVRQKPDITAADRVATATPGFNPFAGTSAAAPHAAAIAALVLQARPNIKNMGNAGATTFMRGLFQSTSIDIEAVGTDRDSGSGIVMADTATAPCAGPSDGMPCDDGSLCTQTDTCQGGVCVGSNLVVCGGDQCSDAGTCNPANGLCSPPTPKMNGTTCSDGSLCTQTDTCQAGVCIGANPVVCMASDQCHDPGVCIPATGACTNPAKGDGTACSDGSLCTQTDTCQGGTCTGANPVVCTGGDQCNDVGTCNPASGLCSAPTPKTNGTTCDDSSACTQADSCQNGACTGGNPVVCPTPDQCHDPGVCNPATGVCSNPAKGDGTACSDGSACTQTDTCQAGTCTGSNPVVCPTPDQCHDPGVCNPGTGVCSNPAKGDGTACSDGSLCTQTDTCQAGTCTGANPVVCTGDQCNDPGTCNPASGVCSAPTPKTNGTTCVDGSACTQTDTCQAGICTGGNPVACPTPDQCHDTGVCNPGTGVCSNPNKANGSPCADNSACTQTDTCQAGICTGSNPVVCPPPDQCHDTGVCNPGTGVCSNPAKGDGTTCNDNSACTQTDTCQAGTCTGSNPIVCPTPDQCHDPGVCNPGTGVCSNPNKANGSPCADNSACTQTDTCQAGTCIGSNPVVCPPPDQCHNPGVCDPANGVCSNPTKGDGTACNDSSACTQTDTCQAGTCTGANPVVCPTPDQCHDPGVCNPANGTCSNPNKANGAPCTDNNACTESDSCQAGACTGSQRDCNDSNVCTDDGCNPTSGCTHMNNTGPCSDGNACTGNDTCAAGNCVSGGAVTCNDTNVCTTDSCVPATGCDFTPNTSPCSDGDECNGNETCDGAGTCTPGPVTPVDDGNPCTIDTCTLADGITHTPVAVGTPCPDADLCDGTEVCNASAACVAGTPLDVNDGNPCTTDGCIPATGATHTPVAAGTACLDATVCNGAEACNANGVCTAGTPPVLTDNNPCTADACDPVTGVSHTLRPAGASCADPDSCDGDETCNATGQCQPGTPVVCTAQDACHVVGTCAPTTGACSNPPAPNGTACPGGACDGGSCVPDGTGGAGGEGTGGTSGTGGATAGEGGMSTGGSAGAGASGEGGETSTGGRGGAGQGGTTSGGETGEAGEGAAGEGTAGSKPKSGGSDEDSGCGCEVPGRARSNGAPLFLACAAALLVVSRRRSGSRRTRPAAAA